jgi:hypothetical protein
MSVRRCVPPVAFGLALALVVGVGVGVSGAAPRRGPLSVVRTMMVAGYGGDGVTACAQLTRSLYRSLGGRSGCPANATSYASPKRKREAQRASLRVIVRGRRAGVSISSPDPTIGDPFEGNSWIHLVLLNGVWKVQCLGYCHGESP